MCVRTLADTPLVDKDQSDCPKDYHIEMMYRVLEQEHQKLGFSYCLSVKGTFPCGCRYWISENGRFLYIELGTDHYRCELTGNEWKLERQCRSYEIRSNAKRLSLADETTFDYSNDPSKRKTKTPAGARARLQPYDRIYNALHARMSGARVAAWVYVNDIQSAPWKGDKIYPFPTYASIFKPVRIVLDFDNHTGLATDRLQTIEDAKLFCLKTGLRPVAIISSHKGGFAFVVEISRDAAGYLGSLVLESERLEFAAHLLGLESIDPDLEAKMHYQYRLDVGVLKKDLLEMNVRVPGSFRFESGEFVDGYFFESWTSYSNNWKQELLDASKPTCWDFGNLNPMPTAVRVPQVSGHDLVVPRAGSRDPSKPSPAVTSPFISIRAEPVHIDSPIPSANLFRSELLKLLLEQQSVIKNQLNPDRAAFIADQFANQLSRLRRDDLILCTQDWEIKMNFRARRRATELRTALVEHGYIVQTRAAARGKDCARFGRGVVLRKLDADCEARVVGGSATFKDTTPDALVAGEINDGLFRNLLNSKLKGLNDEAAIDVAMKVLADRQKSGSERCRNEVESQLARVKGSMDRYASRLAKRRSKGADINLQEGK